MVSEIAFKVAADLQQELVEVSQHASGAYVIHTNLGKGYLPDELDVSDEKAVEGAVKDCLTAIALAALTPSDFQENGELKDVVTALTEDAQEHNVVADLDVPEIVETPKKRGRKAKAKETSDVE